MFGSGECLEFGWGEGVSAVDAPQYARRGEGVGVGVGSDPGDAFELPPGPIQIEQAATGRGTGMPLKSPPLSLAGA